MTQRTPPAHRRAPTRGVDDLLSDAARTPLGGPEGNARLTGATAAAPEKSAGDKSASDKPSQDASAAKAPKKAATSRK